MPRFGKHPPKIDYRTLRLADYLSATLPTPPVSYSALDRVYSGLKVNDPTKLFPMDFNDSLGDCTIAALAHAETVYGGLVGKRQIMAAADVKKLYLKLSGGVDSGLNELDVLNYWRKTGAGGEKITAYASIKPKNHQHVMQAINLFGGVYLGFQCQENVLKDFDAHKPWTPGKLTEDGHAVYATSYDASGVTVLTWGTTQKGTWAWWDECVDESYALLAPEAMQPGFAPGFDSTQLAVDLKAVSG